jgi:hypothetical protein
MLGSISAEGHADSEGANTKAEWEGADTKAESDATAELDAKAEPGAKAETDAKADLDAAIKGLAPPETCPVLLGRGTLLLTWGAWPANCPDPYCCGGTKSPLICAEEPLWRLRAKGVSTSFGNLTKSTLICPDKLLSWLSAKQGST